MRKRNAFPTASPFLADELKKCAANYEPLSPLSFLRRTAAVYPERIAVVADTRQLTWQDVAERSARLASALIKNGIQAGDAVAVMSPNTPEFYEAHFALPMCGAILTPLNIRLDAAALAFILQHSEAKAILVDAEFAKVIAEALQKINRRILVVEIPHPSFANVNSQLPDSAINYASLLSQGDPAAEFPGPADEWQALSLNYTSGTTGNPKGVVYSHRGAYLLAIGNVLAWDITHHPAYLWTLPMFHCNGWCFPWTLAVVAATSICIRKVSVESIGKGIISGATHLCGAPIVLEMTIEAAQKNKPEQEINFMIAAAPPPAATLQKAEAVGIRVTHAYGLTEIYGPAVVCSWKEEWDSLSPDSRGDKKSRQGVAYHVQEGLMTANPQDKDNLSPLPHDGKTIGEVMTRGNAVMMGYYKNPKATREAFQGGWFRTGDLGVIENDGYLRLKDRSKDIIISGGENISSIEVENALHRHPAVSAAAVVAKPDDKWGETPIAFIELRQGESATADDIINFCRQHLAAFKCPREVRFINLPRTATGKMQKFRLREMLSKE